MTRRHNRAPDKLVTAHRALALCVLGLVVLLFCGCVSTCAAVALCDEQCAEEGKCALRPLRIGDALVTCFADSDADCAASAVCQSEGRCSVAETGECRPSVDIEPDPAGRTAIRGAELEANPELFEQRKDVAALQPAGDVTDVAVNAGTDRPARCEALCAEQGQCMNRTIRAGDTGYRCYAGSDADCAASTVCESEGRCFVTERGECQHERDVEAARCAGSAPCLESGWCHPRLGACWANTDADCESSFMCRTVGRCGLRNGVCVPLQASHCTASTGCEVEGACELQSVMGMGNECRVPLHDAAACQQSWICAEYGRCVPGPPEICAECTQFGFCTQPGVLAQQPCTPRASFTEPCSVDGRCARDPEGQCQHAPDTDADMVVASRPTDVATTAPLGNEPPRQFPSSPQIQQPEPATPTPTEPAPSEPAPSGPGSVAYDFSNLGGNPYSGELTYASVLTGIEGLDSDGPIDTLVFRTVAGDTCRPRAEGGFLPLDAVWFLFDLPSDTSTHELEGGYMPGQASAKTWTWDGRAGSSHNFGVHGTLVIESRTETEVRGRVVVRAQDYLTDALLGTLEGPFVAQVIDCSEYTGGWPM